ncbi:MAG: hypothetical protein ACKO2V_23515 [Snowella sp.]
MIELVAYWHNKACYLRVLRNLDMAKQTPENAIAKIKKTEN